LLDKVDGPGSPVPRSKRASAVTAEKRGGSFFGKPLHELEVVLVTISLNGSDFPVLIPP